MHPSGEKGGSSEPSPRRATNKKSLKRLLAEARISKLPTCGSTGHLVIGHNKKTGEYKGVYRPHSCGSIFCPYCSKRKKFEVLGKYRGVLIETKEPLMFVTLTSPRNEDFKEALELITKGLEKLYQYRLFGKRNWKKVRKLFFEELKRYRQELKEKKIPAKEIERKIKIQIRYFKKLRRYKSIPNAEKLKFGQIFPALWMLEFTKECKEGNKGYLLHWHGIVVGRFPKILLTALWRHLTGWHIVDVRAINRSKKDRRDAVDYLIDYIETASVDEEGAGEGGCGYTKEEMVEIEEALHGRRKVRAWGFDLFRPNSSSTDDGWEWVHAYRMRLRLVGQSKKTNLKDFYVVKRKLRREKLKRYPYIVVEVENGDYYFNGGMVLLGYLTEEGMIELEPFNGRQKEEWEETLVGLFDCKGRVEEYFVPVEAVFG